ncbi:hypothetical protein [Paraburkholderia caffeinilytica]|uniref:hypothetical protein n=1 Tax=Paraburkholderia caffeinilytica TaxID=1761016 RepID=UPI003D9FD136
MYRMLFATMALICSTCLAAPCDSVNRDITAARKAVLAPAITRQLLRVPSVEVLRSFRLDQWSIIYVSTPVSESGFLFYSDDPLSSRYLTIWAGMAWPNEEDEIRNWALKNVSGIPVQLAACFAWYVTKNRDR